MKQKIFVYGTLRKGMYNYDLYLRDEKSFRYYAYAKGSLMTILGRVYPAYLTDGQDMILGEIHEVSDETMNSIDQLEGYLGEGNPKNEYNKELCDIYNEQGEVVEQAYIYVYNMENPSNVFTLGKDIESHDYVEYIQKVKLREKSLFDYDVEQTFFI